MAPGTKNKDYLSRLRKASSDGQLGARLAEQRHSYQFMIANLAELGKRFVTVDADVREVGRHDVPIIAVHLKRKWG